MRSVTSQGAAARRKALRHNAERCVAPIKLVFKNRAGGILKSVLIAPPARLADSLHATDALAVAVGTTSGFRQIQYRRGGLPLGNLDSPCPPLLAAWPYSISVWFGRVNHPQHEQNPSGHESDD